jgi:hypothetical protein
MHLRPSARLLAAAGALALATSLTSCGFDYATDRVYTPAAGPNDRDADVDVLGAVVVSGQEGSGTFIASFSNNDREKTLSVDSLTATTSGDDASDLTIGDFDPIEIPPGGLVNLADDGGISVEGDLDAGDFVDIELGFDNGQSASMSIPVYPPCNEYEGLDTTASAAPTTDPCEVEEPAESEAAE